MAKAKHKRSTNGLRALAGHTHTKRSRKEVPMTSATGPTNTAPTQPQGDAQATNPCHEPSCTMPNKTTKAIKGLAHNLRDTTMAHACGPNIAHQLPNISTHACACPTTMQKELIPHDNPGWYRTHKSLAPSPAQPPHDMRAKLAEKRRNNVWWVLTAFARDIPCATLGSEAHLQAVARCSA